MSSSPSSHLKDLFSEASKLPVARRAEFLDERCAGDAVLRDRLEALLRAQDEAGEFLSHPTMGDDDTTAADAPRHSPGVTIGPYKLLECIGDGGFGVVYMAEQLTPVRRRVAIKIIKPGMDTARVIARFEQERQALALMDHPNIARVLDAGATAEGRPYFAMELVKGEPITRYCDAAGLTPAERLELFGQVCNAVQHAHQKGIIHRDIKPSNVLVTLHDGRPVPKVIDFGIAKATQGRLTEKTLFTAHREMIGTPEYMSPEQAEMSGLDIDTRTDIYSLGVLLYELLTGTTPFDGAALRAAAYAELQRIIREVDPPKPSTRLSKLGGALSGVAAQRRTEPRRLSALVRGDLDWIVMKALSKDRTRRYASASGLAADVLRHLAGEAVVAAPPSAAYRARKFVRRNRRLVAATGVVAVSLLAGMAGTLWQAREASHQRELALEQAAAASRNADAERQRADELNQVVEFQSDWLARVDLEFMGVQLRRNILDKRRESLAAHGADAAAIDSDQRAVDSALAGVNFSDIAKDTMDEHIFKDALAAIDTRFRDQPLVKARMLQTTASTLRKLGLLDQAAAPQREALEIRRRLLGDDHHDTLTSINNTALLLHDLGSLAEAETLAREALAGRHRVLGEEHPNTLGSFSTLGVVLNARGLYEDAELLYREAVEKSRRLLGDDHEITLNALNSMGTVLRQRSQFGDAEACFREAVEGRRRTLGHDHPSTLMAISNLALALNEQRKHSEAEPLYLEALEARRRVLGDNHPQTLISINNIAALHRDRGELDKAEPYVREAMERARYTLGAEHPSTLTYIYNYGRMLRMRGDLAEAEPYHREVLDARRRVLGPEHPDTIWAILNLGVLLQDLGRLREAEPLIRDALDLRRRVLPADHPDTLTCTCQLGILLVLDGRHAEAIDVLEPIVPRARRVHAGTNETRLGVLLLTLGRARAGKEFESAGFLSAERELLEAHAILDRTRGSSHKDTVACVEALAGLYDRWSTAEPGRGHETRATEWRRRLAPAK